MSTAKFLAEALEDVTVDALVTNQHAEQLVEQLAAALDARGYVLSKKPKARKAAAPLEVFNPNTGDSELDDFMRRTHKPDWQARLKKALAKSRPGMLTISTPAAGLPSKALTQAERAELYRQHNVIQHSA